MHRSCGQLGLHQQPQQQLQLQPLPAILLPGKCCVHLQQQQRPQQRPQSRHQAVPLLPPAAASPSSSSLHSSGVDQRSPLQPHSHPPQMASAAQQLHGRASASAAVARAGKSAGGRGPAWRPPPQQQQQQAPPPPSPPPLVDPSSIDSDGLAGIFMAYATQLQQAMQQQQQSSAGPSPGANVVVKNLGFHPPGAEHPLLDGVSFHLKPNQLGLIIGRSGSGKTTLLQLLAGLSEQTSGEVFIHRPSAGDHASGLFVPTHIEQRMQQVGLVFQFPERHFLGDDVMQEMTFTWPRAMSHWGQRQAMAVRLQQVIDGVGLSDIPFTIPPSALSGGQQRRLALALQLVRAPSLLLLDEPLAGLDWHARREVVALLAELKKEATLLVVSHDLADIAPLVDCAWRMEMGGRMEAVEWPPDSLSDIDD